MSLLFCIYYALYTILHCKYFVTKMTSALEIGFGCILNTLLTFFLISICFYLNCNYHEFSTEIIFHSDRRHIIDYPSCMRSWTREKELECVCVCLWIRERFWAFNGYVGPGKSRKNNFIWNQYSIGQIIIYHFEISIASNDLKAPLMEWIMQSNHKLNTKTIFRSF